MKLSKQEYKYRYKLFYENHYNKFAQQALDYYIQEQNTTYKNLYFQKSTLDVCLMPPTSLELRMRRRALKKIGVSLKDDQGNFRCECDVLRDISDKWNRLGELNDH